MKMKQALTAALVGMFSMAVVLPALAAKHTTDSIDQMEKNLTARKAVLVDVREDHETNKGYIDGAILVPLSLLTEAQSFEGFGQVLAQRIPTGTTVYTYCKTGNRCLLAADILAKFGYDARPLRHGFQQLVAEGFVVAKPKSDEPGPEVFR